MLYILLERVPATVFYFVVLTLQILITSAPMNCFVMFSQLVIITVNHGPQFQGALIAELDITSRAVFKAILTGYRFWNLDFFRYFIPPFCVNQGLTNIHRSCPPVYVSAFYPLLLIALTYTCVELHGHNFRPIVWLWKPFTDVSTLEGVGFKSILFATFFLLFYSKLIYVSLFLLQGHRYTMFNGEPVPGTSYVLLTDATVQYLSKEHLHLL